MRRKFFATAAILSLTIGTATVDRAPSVQQALMAPQATATGGTAFLQFAAGGGNHPDAGTDEHGTQYEYAAAGGGGEHPWANTDEHGTQEYAAADFAAPAASRHVVQLAQGWHSRANTDA